MSHHLVTVCMVCLLCATHKICGSHLSHGSNLEASVFRLQPDYERIEHDAKDDIERREDALKELEKDESLVHRIENVEEKSPRYYQKLRKIRMYGDPETMTMNITGFNDMLKTLNLDKLIEGGLQNTGQKEYFYGQAGQKEMGVNCVSSPELISTVNTILKPVDHHHPTEHEHEHESTITEQTIQSICPILLYQKLANTSIEKEGCLIENSPLTTRRKDLSAFDGRSALEKNTLNVWLYSTLSIIAISACGLFGVAVIPIMHKTYYNHLLQFLVALAVGTLCGDALLHLMPHAMSPVDVDNDLVVLNAPASSHDDGMWKGLAAMMGVVFFYFTEKGLTVIVEWRKRRQKIDKEKKLPAKVRVLKEETACGCSGGSKAPINNSTGNSLLKIFKKDEKGDSTTKTCKHKYSEYPYCYDEIDVDTHDELHHRDGQVPSSPKNNRNHNTLSIVSTNALSQDVKDEPTAKDWLLNSETAPSAVEMNNIQHKDGDNKDVKEGDSYTVILRLSNKHLLNSLLLRVIGIQYPFKMSPVFASHFDDSTAIDDMRSIISRVVYALRSVNIVYVRREHSRAHHGHSHAHGHVHAPPSSMSSVAWMVIMGDGLHNFTDGMAIGAAFASNIAGGFSTAIAVLCHELPHELGDFAVLLKAGMSVRRAVCYNALSSALCLVGMVCGVVAGHTPWATRWLFAVAAGTFLYIALVDMMPELSTSHSNEGTLCQCILQLAGLCSGIGIMLVIAMYEHDLKNLFG
ncbi:Zinc transporter foi [Eumeta japonica]|uniref:Zinc transporter foi n=1 Tax=Eumeta variegata TaxID=151549 RepID=A0A4C1WGH4_EUMVA|nr:Zinc transporter foi [Eumeta japonica]